MVDDANDDPVDMIATLAKSMMAERRGRFLDAACGGDPELRAEVEALLAKVPSNDNSIEPQSGELPDQTPDLERDCFNSIESIALEALSEIPDENKSLHMDNADNSVEDLPIDIYCDQKQLDTVARLRLFQQACQIIDEDHRRGLIHGGLTARHIKISPEGSLHVCPQEESDQAAEHFLKSGYASPEQVLGEPLTTATDVYQLGVLLYELLTGRGPYRLRSQDPQEIGTAIVEQVPERPSLAVSHPDKSSEATGNCATARQTSRAQLQKLLAGDLELIVLHALHKEPERRYATPQQLAGDIDQFLQGRPVRAHRESRSYRAAMLVRRHPAATSLGLLLAAALITGLISSIIELRRAHRERDRAEASFQISRKAVDNLFTQIDVLPQFGALGLEPLRATLLENLLRYYENILDLRGNDPGARELVADAQRRIARGDHLIGLPDVAAWQLQRAVERYEDLIVHEPGETRYQDELATILDEIGEILISTEGRNTDALPFLKRAQGLLEAGLAPEPKTTSRHRELARVLSHLAEAEVVADHPDRAQAALRQAIGILDELVIANPQKEDIQITLASAQIALGRVLSANPANLDHAITAFARGIDLRETITREHPERFDQVHELALDLGELAAVEQQAGGLEFAIQHENQAMERLEQLDRRFPEMVSYQRALYVAYDRAAHIRSQQGEIKAALKLAGQAQTVLERLLVQHARELVYQVDLSRCHSFIGRLLYGSRRFADAFRAFQRAVDLLESVPQLDPANSYQLAVNLALCISLIGAGPTSPPPDDDAELGPADQLRRQVYGTRAVAALSQAIAGGIATLDMCQSDADLDSLRNRLDFQKLLKDMAEKNSTKP